MDPFLGIWIGILLGLIIISIMRLPISILRTKEKPFFFPGWYSSLMITPPLLYYLYFSLQLFRNTLFESITYAPTAIIYAFFFGFFFVIFYSRLFQEDLFSHSKLSIAELFSQVLDEDEINHTKVKPNLFVQLLYLGANLSVLDLGNGSILIIESAISKLSPIRFKSIPKQVRNKIKQDLISIIPQSNVSLFKKASYIIGSIFSILFSLMLIILTLGVVNFFASGT